jgi:RHS repeat-associated protein
LDGNPKTKTDQNGNINTFSYDARRRPIADAVTTLGNNVDGTVRKIARSYTTRGALEKVSSIDSQNAVLNEVKYEYDSNLSLKKLRQSYSGSVTTSTPYLEYSYDSAHDNRLSGVVYPSGKSLSYNYNTFDNITSISEGTTPLVSYIYDGSGNPMQTIYNEPNVSLTYVNGGLDRYGRIINHSWVKNTNPLVHIIHSYDYNGNRTKRYDPVHAANSELYTYDNIGQIKSLNRGILNNDHTSVTTVNHSESWNFDKTGNWSQYTRNGNMENRTHNAANELQNIATHDANGNMVLMPGLKGKYDAWNRLVEVRDSNDNLIAQYEYNGLNQRIKKTVGTTVTKSFFNENWQELESITNNQVTSYVWGIRYIDDLVLREKGEECLYSFADPNWNIIAICDASGDVQERYTYDAFGKRNVFNANFTAKMGTEFDWNRAFTGQVIEVETGLMLYRRRYYSMELGRFVNRDPISFYGNDVNFFRYVFNASTIMVDTLGLKEGYLPTTKPTTKPTTMPKRWPIRLPPTTTKCVPMAGGCGIADGPAPFGDIIGAGIVVCALVYDIYICTRPDPDPVLPPVPPQPRCPKDDEDETCAEKYPGYVSCDDYPYPSSYPISKVFGQNAKCDKHEPATSCGDGGGTHSRVSRRGEGFLGTWLCCTCCSNKTGKAQTQKRCKGI